MIMTSQHGQSLWTMQSMENSADRFFKGFSLEDYRLQVLVKSLEKEKRQCLNRLKEETHVFKMSARLPVKRGQEYWSQYGENFHANGDKREKASVTHLSAEYNKEDLNSINTADQDNTNSSKHRSVVIPSNSPQHGSGNRNVQRNSLQRMRSVSNRKYDSSKKPKVSGLTLLDILCGDFEHGVILLEKNNKQSDSSFGNTSKDLGHQRDKQSKKAHKEGGTEKPFPSDIYKSLKSESKKENFIRSQTSKENRLDVAHSEVDDTNSSSMSKSVSFEVLNSDDTPNTSSISTWGLNSQESVPLRDVSAQKLNWTSDNSVNSFGLGEAEESLQSSERQSHEWNQSSKQTQGKIEFLAAENAEHSASSNKVEESISSNQACLTSSSERQVWKHQCRFVHLKEGRKLTRKKGNKQKLGVNMNNEKEKLNRNKSPEVKLFQVDVPHTSQERKSQEEIDRETRQKMDNFFAKVEHTKNFQPGKPRWRCSSSSERAERRSEWKNCLEAGKRPHAAKKHGYRRAQPWPTEVWS